MISIPEMIDSTTCFLFGHDWQWFVYLETEKYIEKCSDCGATR